MNTGTKTTGWRLVALLFVLLTAGACSPAAISAGGIDAAAAGGSRPIERRAPLPAPAATAVAGATLAGLSTTEQLALALPPERNLRNLTLQLNPNLEDVPLSIAGEPPRYALGDSQSFWVRNTTTNRVAEISATLVYSTPVVYIWVESGQEYDLEALERSADRFSSVTYPNVVNTFGSEWRPGVDNDGRLHILYNTGMGSGVSGYFSGADEYTQPVVSFSNQKEMFYINLAALNSAGDYAGHDRTLAHELQHMVHWHMDRSEDLWLNEGLSEYAQEVAEFSAGSGFSGAFAADPDVQLTTWGAIGGNRPHYGAAYLFMVYLAQRFGREAVTNLVADPTNGLQSVTDALASVGAGIDAEGLFADWIVANYANQPDALGESGRYGYTGIRPPSFALAAQHAAYPVQPQGATVANFAADYIELGGDGDVVFSFTGATETRLADMELGAGERAWWSNRADSADARLLARYDLSGIAPGAPLTLTASMWWDIETDYDFGYVMAGSDGEHWRILPGQHTAASNPSGNAFGPGYTGASDRGGPDDAPAWVAESFDLSAFGGGPLWLELRYITDDGVNAPGWWVDNLQLAGPDGVIDPVADGAAGSGNGEDMDSEGVGWQSSGWLLSDNRLPQRWLLQVLEFDGDTLAAVRRVPVDQQGRAEVRIAGLGNGRRAVVAVSGLSPVTTQPAQYEYAIRLD